MKWPWVTGRVHQQPGGIHVGHYGHQIHRLVIGRLVHLQGVDDAPVVVAGVGHATDDGYGHAFHAGTAVKTVDGPDKPCSVARRQLQELGVQALLVIGVSMEEDVGDLVFLAALERRPCCRA